MIKKLFSKALMSVVMDKDARDKLKTGKRSKPAKKSRPQAEPAEAPPTESPEARSVTPPMAAENEDTHQLILDSLRAAEQELTEKRDMTPDRQALIQQAMNMHRSKAHILDDISPEQREKLYVVALKSLEAAPETGPSRNKVRGKKKSKK